MIIQRGPGNLPCSHRKKSDAVKTDACPGLTSARGPEGQLAPSLFSFLAPSHSKRIVLLRSSALGGRFSLKASMPVSNMRPLTSEQVCAFSFGARNQLCSLSVIPKAKVWDASCKIQKEFPSESTTVLKKACGKIELKD